MLLLSLTLPFLKFHHLLPEETDTVTRRLLQMYQILYYTQYSNKFIYQMTKRLVPDPHANIQEYHTKKFLQTAQGKKSLKNRVACCLITELAFN